MGNKGRRKKGGRKERKKKRVRDVFVFWNELIMWN